jgi:mRNA-degrading endonuclease toxin of MazEF toxin-antitoxin module
MHKPGDIVLIKMHPASGVELKKFRPAVILHEHLNRGFVTFIPFTSQAKIYSPNTEFLVHPSDENGLEKTSLLLCWYIQTVGNQRIQRNIGKLDKKEWSKIAKAVRQILPL